MSKQIIPRNKQKLVYIKWQDAHSQGGWLSPQELEKEINGEMFICEEVGWIVFEDNDEIHIVSRRGLWNVQGAKEYGMYQRIPKTWILKKRSIKL